MTSRQTVLPIIRAATKSIVGYYTLGGFFNYGGLETTQRLVSGSVVNISKWTPNTFPNPDTNPWFMAVIIDEPNFSKEAYSGYPEFTQTRDALPNRYHTSPNTSPNLFYDTPGVLLDILGKKANVGAVGFATPNQPLLNLVRNTLISAPGTTVLVVSPDVVVNTGSIVPTGTLPSGLSYSNSGNTIRVVGTPTVAGTFNCHLSIPSNINTLEVDVTYIVV